MKFITLQNKLKDFIVFTINDIRKIERNFDLRRLYEWQKKGYIRSIRRGYYMFSDMQPNEHILYIAANTMYSPSYISLEMAFSYYNLIPEAVYSITSVTSCKTNAFQTSIGNFVYKSVKPSLLFGYVLKKYHHRQYKIASIEKAALDFFYLNSHLQTEDDFAGIRFNAASFKEQADREKLEKYLAIFSQKKLEKRVRLFLKFIQYA